MNSRIGWGQPPPGWGQSFPGWAPLVNPGPRPLQLARTLGRWVWPTLAAGGFLAVIAYVVEHDPSAPGLSYRGLLTVALAAAMVVLLTIHRRYGPRWLARALAKYTAVALLATLLAVPAGTVDQRPADPAKPTGATHAQAKPDAEAAAGQDQPTVIRAVTKVARAGAKVVRAVTGAVRWLVELWHRADQQATTRGEAMAAPPPVHSSIWRSHL